MFVSLLRLSLFVVVVVIVVIVVADVSMGCNAQVGSSMTLHFFNQLTSIDNGFATTTSSVPTTCSSGPTTCQIPASMRLTMLLTVSAISTSPFPTRVLPNPPSPKSPPNPTPPIPSVNPPFPPTFLSPKILLSSPPWTTSLHNAGQYVVDKVIEYVDKGGLAGGSEERNVLEDAAGEVEELPDPEALADTYRILLQSVPIVYGISADTPSMPSRIENMFCRRGSALRSRWVRPALRAPKWLKVAGAQLRGRTSATRRCSTSQTSRSSWRPNGPA